MFVLDNESQPFRAGSLITFIMLTEYNYINYNQDRVMSKYEKAICVQKLFYTYFYIDCL